MAVVAAVRKAVVSMVEVAIKKLNRVIGSEEELAPINLGVRVTRLICQIHLQRLATGEDLGQKISALVAVKAAPRNEKNVRVWGLACLCFGPVRARKKENIACHAQCPCACSA